MRFQIPLCEECGACCAHDDPVWIEVTAFDRMHIPMELLSEDLKSMRMIDGRCAALKGQPGACSIYEIRPLACRQISPGSNLCLYMLGYHRMPCIRF